MFVFLNVLILDAWKRAETLGWGDEGPLESQFTYTVFLF